MSTRIYTFNKIINPDHIELIVDVYNRHQFGYGSEFEVFAGICEVLYDNGFKVYLDGMNNEEIDWHFNWDEIAKYKNVVRFQLTWSYLYHKQ